LRASLTQSILDLTARNNYRSANEVYRANQFSVRDARDLVVLAVGGAYLQVIATKERVKSARAQFETANALYQQNGKREASAWWLRLTSTGAKSKRLLSNNGSLHSRTIWQNKKSVWLE